MNYTIDIRVTGEMHISVNADTKEQALSKANDIMTETDFGELSEINWDVVNVDNN